MEPGFHVFKITYSNRGQAATPSTVGSIVRVTRSDGLQLDFILNDLSFDPGALHTVGVQYVASHLQLPVAYAVTFTADFQNGVPESDESDNICEVTFTVFALNITPVLPPIAP